MSFIAHSDHNWFHYRKIKYKKKFGKAVMQKSPQSFGFYNDLAKSIVFHGGVPLLFWHLHNTFWLS